MNKKIIIAVLSCIFLLITGVCYSCSFQSNQDHTKLQSSLTKVTITPLVTEGINKGAKENQDIKNGSNQDELEDATIYVHLCGAVEKPGVYQVSQDARISEIIKMAGGFNPDAAGDFINQAKKVLDGQRIYIPTVEEVATLSKNELIQGDNSLESGNNQDTTKNGDTSSQRININTASAEQLMNLPGIGQAKADSIINYRTENGRFKKIEDIMNISGIKEGLFRKMEAYIIVE